jgi:cell division protein FtsL
MEVNMKEKIIYSLTAVLIAVILGGSYIYVSNKREETKRIEQKQTTSIKQEHPNQSELNDCLAEVEDARRLSLEDNTKKANDAGYAELPSDSYNSIESQYVERKNTCFKQYPVN